MDQLVGVGGTREKFAETELKNLESRIRSLSDEDLGVWYSHIVSPIRGTNPLLKATLMGLTDGELKVWYSLRVRRSKKDEAEAHKSKEALPKAMAASAAA